ncbi:MerR family transcriptional regulator [Pseudomonas syringae]|nr:MerR family transcriptional regulator [Pseudomonas syringae pv. syringae]TRN92121.1 MerR family transcriptional regulator [Pseudomonas syringae]
MDISAVAKSSGVPASTLRYYETKGLIRALSPPGTRRRFSPDVIDRLALIALGQAGGLSLDEIGKMLSANGSHNIDRELLLIRADELDATAKRLRAMSAGLRHAAACPSPDHEQCPAFQRLLKIATATRQREHFKDRNSVK